MAVIRLEWDRLNREELAFVIVLVVAIVILASLRIILADDCQKLFILILGFAGGLKKGRVK